MQVFTDQASHRDRVLFELRLKRKSNFMSFSVVQGGVGVPPHASPYLSLRFVLIMNEMI